LFGIFNRWVRVFSRISATDGHGVCVDLRFE